MSGLLHALVLDGAGGARPLDWAGVAAWSPNDGVLWLNLDYTQPDAKAWIERTIDPLVRDALLDPDPRPRAVAHGEDLLLIVRGINANEGYSPEAMLSVRAFIEPRRIVTLRHRVSRTVETIARDIEARRGPKNAAELTVTLVERIVEHAVTHIDELGDQVAASEELVLSETRVDVRGKLAGLRRRAISLRRYLAPQRDALGKLSAINLPWLEAEHKARVGEVADRMLRTVEELDAARDPASFLLNERWTPPARNPRDASHFAEAAGSRPSPAPRFAARTPPDGRGRSRRERLLPHLPDCRQTAVMADPRSWRSARTQV